MDAIGHASLTTDMTSSTNARNSRVLVLQAGKEDRFVAVDEGDFHAVNEVFLKLESIPPLLSNDMYLWMLDGERRVFCLYLKGDINPINPRFLPLPTYVLKLKNLKTLHVDKTEISSIPPSIKHLQNLEHLRIIFNKNLTDLPEEIGDMVGLKTLDFWCSNIESIPHSIGKLANLKVLGMSHTRIETLPCSIRDLQNLEYLNLDGTENMLELPKEIGNLSSLKKLRLGRSAITSIPSSIRRLKNLEAIDLSGTQNLLELPEEIGDLGNLKSFNLIFSKIKFLPRSIGRLKNLEELNLSYTDIVKDIDSFNRTTEIDARIQYLIMITKCCSSLGFLGREIHEYRTKMIGYQLACNRARIRIGFGTAKVKSMQMLPRLWPFFLYMSSQAFDKKYSNQKSMKIQNQDAIYQLLVDGRESFICFLINR